MRLIDSLRAQYLRVDSTKRRVLIAVSFLSLSVFLVLVRIMGLEPRVMSDELTYSVHSRLLPIADSPIPNYLFLALYRSTNMCGPEFYSCARLLNVFFLLVGALFIFLIASKVLQFRWSLLIGIAAIIGPTSLYAANFMPDTMFYAFSIAYLWAVLGFIDENSSWKHFLVFGVAVGVVSLVKPHGLFLLIALPVVILVSKGIHLERVKQAIKALFLSVASALLIKLGVSFLVAGTKGLALFRVAYGQGLPQVDTSVKSQDISISDQLLGFLNSGNDLFFAIAGLFAIPLVISLLIQGREFRPNHRYLQRLGAATLAVLLVFFVAVAVFSSQLQLIDETQSIRVQMRYIEFLFLLLPIIVGGFIKVSEAKTGLVTRGLVALTAAVSLIWSFEYIELFIDVYSDSTFLTMLARWKSWGLLVFLAAAAVGLVALFRMRWAAASWVFLIYPILVLGSIPVMYQDPSLRTAEQSSYMTAAQFTKGTLSPSDLNRLVVIGENKQEVEATRFLLDNAKVGKRVLDNALSLNLEALPPRFSWALILGDQDIFTTTNKTYEGNGFTLIARDLGEETFFDLENPGKAIFDLLGFQDRGYLGTWTTGELSVIVLSQPPLPGQTMTIRFSASPDLVGKTVVFSLGQEEIEVPISVAREVQEIGLTFENQAGFRDLAVSLPVSEPQPGAVAGLRFHSLRLR